MQVFLSAGLDSSRYFWSKKHPQHAIHALGEGFAWTTPHKNHRLWRVSNHSLCSERSARQYPVGNILSVGK